MAAFAAALISASVLTLALASFARADEEVQWTYRYPSKQKIDIDANLLGQCMALTSRCGRYLPYIDKDLGEERFDMDDFVLYLEANHVRRYDFRGANEGGLKAWVLAQPDDSIDPLSIFKE